jgi:hypothetical protein
MMQGLAKKTFFLGTVLVLPVNRESFRIRLFTSKRKAAPL